MPKAPEEAESSPEPAFGGTHIPWFLAPSVLKAGSAVSPSLSAAHTTGLLPRCLWVSDSAGD